MKRWSTPGEAFAYETGYIEGRADIVRCKDCKHSVKQKLGYGCEMKYRLATNGKFFCADGERRMDNAEMHL